MGHFKPSNAFDPVHLTILADNDYYSQPHTSPTTSSASCSGAAPSRFAKFPTKLKDAHKTGLGSSAALVTALTAALLTHYLPPSVFDLESEKGRQILHNLAQAAHCAAQGKVGSGFDVAAAVYGSCVYRRFSPSVLRDLPEVGTPGFAPALAACVESADRWDTQVAKEGVRVPPGLVLRMCDVDCGSQTVGMVKQVLKWRDETDPAGAKQLWDDLQARNEALGQALLQATTTTTTDQNSSSNDGIRDAVAQIRHLVREMGRRSGVPIEPDSQTQLLDALRDGVDGVLEGVVPGAGGFDALVLLTRDDEKTENSIREFLRKWSEEKGAKVKLLGVKGEMQGVRREGPAQYEGWLG